MEREGLYNSIKAEVDKLSNKEYDKQYIGSSDIAALILVGITKAVCKNTWARIQRLF